MTHPHRWQSAVGEQAAEHHISIEPYMPSNKATVYSHKEIKYCRLVCKAFQYKLISEDRGQFGVGAMLWL